MTPHKSEACRAEIEMLLEYDMIEPLEITMGLRSSNGEKERGAAYILFSTFVT